MLKVNDKVIDNNGYIGIVTNIWKDTGQIQVKQTGKQGTNYKWNNVICTYDSERQLHNIHKYSLKQE